jgi:CDP-glycerol glycerophosphotransferase (TagB/SpsB family)
VSAQAEKINLIYKYETGTTQYLVGQGYDYATFVPDLYPYHPVYGPSAFELIARGFPLVKRQLLSDNPYGVPDLADWKARLSALVPEAPVDMLERNLLRTAADDRLRRSLAIRTEADGTVRRERLLTRAEFRVEDRWAPKYDHWWAFPVCAYDHTLAGNERAVFEEVRDDPSVKKIILTRSRTVDLTGENVVIVPLLSREGQHYLARSRQIFVKHGPRINARWPLSPITHNFVNLWHGIPLKRFGSAMVSQAVEDDPVIMRNNRGCRAVVTSSKVDALTMATAFYPLSLADMWPTGLPRNDMITRAEDRLPEDLRATEARLREEVGDRRLVLFLPTFKDGQADSYHRFREDEVRALGEWAAAHNAVLGVREHMADRAHTYSTMLAPLGPIDLSSRRYPDLEVLYRVADGLVSDYSSCLVDFLLTGRPVVSFAYDLDRYSAQERGLFYDLEKVLPGPVCRSFDELLAGLHGIFQERTEEQREEYEWRRRLFFDHVDDRASSRVVERVRAWYVPSDAD